MAKNLIFDSVRGLSLAASDPGTPASGDPVRVGQLPGVALTDEGDGGHAATDVGIDFGPAVYDLSVKGIDDNGNVAVAIGDPLYYVDADTPKLSKKQSGYFFGFALEAVTSGSTDTIRVLVGVTPGNGALNDPQGVIDPDELGIPIRNETGGALAESDLVYISSWSETQQRFLVSKADADVSGARAQYVMRGSLANNTNGTAYKTHESTADKNTNGASVGDAVYLDTTAGGWTLSAPTGATAVVQIVGRVAVVSATVGQIEFNLAVDIVTKWGTNEMQDAAVTQAKIAANSLNGTVAGNVADGNVIGGIPVVHRIDITAGANGDTDVTLTHKTRVIDAWLILRGAGVMSATLQVKNGANAITDAMAASGSDKALVRAAEIDDAQHEIAAGGTLRVTGAGGATQPDATVYVLGYRVA